MGYSYRAMEYVVLFCKYILFFETFQINERFQDLDSSISQEVVISSFIRIIRLSLSVNLKSSFFSLT